MAIGGFVGRGNEVKLVRDLVMRPAKPKGSMTPFKASKGLGE